MIIANHSKRAQRRLEQIEATITALSDEDLLHLADIFVGSSAALLTKMVTVEMARRGNSF